MPARETYCWWFRNLAPVDLVNIPLFTGFIHPSWCRISSINSLTAQVRNTHRKKCKRSARESVRYQGKNWSFNCFCSVNFWKSSVLPPFFFETKKLWSTWSPVPPFLMDDTSTQIVIFLASHVSFLGPGPAWKHHHWRKSVLFNAES